MAIVIGNTSISGINAGGLPSAYYNSTNEFLYVPWEPSGTAQLNLECTASYNTGGSNQYNFYLEGVICGTNV